MNTAEKASAHLRCGFEASAGFEILWHKNNERLTANHHVNDKYSIHTHKMNGEPNTTTLTVHMVEKGDLGDYKCTVSNERGTESADVHLTFVPEPPHFENFTKIGKNITTHWSIHSIYPLTVMEIYFQKDGVMQSLVRL